MKFQPQQNSKIIYYVDSEDIYIKTALILFFTPFLFLFFIIVIAAMLKEEMQKQNYVAKRIESRFINILRNNFLMILKKQKNIENQRSKIDDYYRMNAKKYVQTKTKDEKIVVNLTIIRNRFKYCQIPGNQRFIFFLYL